MEFNIGSYFSFDLSFATGFAFVGVFLDLALSARVMWANRVSGNVRPIMMCALAVRCCRFSLAV